MLKMNLTLVFDQDYQYFSIFSLSQVLAKHMCARGYQYCQPYFSTMRSLCQRQSGAQGNGLGHPLQGSGSS